jgi:hypothetical protein
MVSEKNWYEVILQVAHKEIIQEPAFIADCWRPVLNSLQRDSLSIDQLIAALTPTGRKVTKLMTLEPEVSTAKQQKIFAFLKQYISKLNSSNLKQFLRFCTGEFQFSILVCLCNRNIITSKMDLLIFQTFVSGAKIIYTVFHSLKNLVTHSHYELNECISI